MLFIRPFRLLPMLALLTACGGSAQQENTEATTSGATTQADTSATAGRTLRLPAPDTTHEVKHFVNVIGWPAGRKPTVPAGFAIAEYAGQLQNPRWVYQAPNGDVFVAESNTVPRTSTAKGEKKEGLQKSRSMRQTSANRITLLRDTNKDGQPDLREIFLTGLNQPFGMLVLGNAFYVANTDGLLKYPYQAGQTKMTAPGQKILSLPAGGYNNHWTRNLLASPDGQKIYVSVGSGSNVMEHGAENEIRRANILQINPDGSGEKIYAAGLRNPVGMAWQPSTNVLWTTVNERDELGDELVPDYLTSVKEGGFYGWPYAYFGQNEDPRRQGERPDLVKQTLVPEVPLGAHTASLGLAFYDKSAFPARYQGGAFVGQHGSWNRSTFSGYKVVFVPFKNGRPAGPAQDFLTGFLVGGNSREAYGRPVGTTVLADGSLLVTDDAGNKIWRVRASQGSRSVASR
jgi:glucose/arabinose dehydrogenase